jgi:hypothetical protein
MTNSKIIIDATPRLILSVYVKGAPFDEAKAELESKGSHIASLEEFAKIIIAQGKDAHLSYDANTIKEGFLHIPKKGIFLVRNSPILPNAKEATACHRKRKEFYLTKEQVEESLTNSIQFKDNSSVPTKRLAEDERTAFAFGETAKVYGEFLDSIKIKEMPIYLSGLEKKPFVRQAWLRKTGWGYKSVLLGEGSALDCNDVLRGVLNGRIEYMLQKKDGAYTLKQIEKALESLGFSGLEKSLIAKLQKEE